MVVITRLCEPCQVRCGDWDMTDHAAGKAGGRDTVRRLYTPALLKWKIYSPVEYRGVGSGDEGGSQSIYRLTYLCRPPTIPLEDTVCNNSPASVMPQLGYGSVVCVGALSDSGVVASMAAVVAEELAVALPTASTESSRTSSSRIWCKKFY